MPRLAVLITFPLLFVTAPAQSRPTVFGTVPGLDGKPAADVRVQFLAPRPKGAPSFLAAFLQQPPAQLGEVVTDSRGRFTFALEQAETTALVAIGSDGARSAVFHPVTPGSIVEVPLLANEVRVMRLEVLPRPARGLAGLRVCSWQQCAPEGPGMLVPDPYRSEPPPPLLLLGEGRTAVDGSFELRAPVAGRWILACRELALRSWMEPGAGPMVRVHVATKDGRVLDARSGESVKGAKVWPVGAADMAVVSDAEGRFSLTAAGDPYVCCSAPGYQPDLFTMSSAEVRLQPAPAVRVRLVDAGDRPVAGARLALVHWTQGPVGGGPVPIWADTDQGGVVECSGGYAVTGYLCERDVVVRLFALPAGRRDEEKVVVSSRRQLRGTVVGPDGAPAQHVPVFLLRADAPERERVWSGREPVAFTDHGGRFVIADVFDGDHLLASRSLAGLPAIVECKVSAQTAAPQLKITAAPRVRGRVLGADGKPEPRALVGLHRGVAEPGPLRWFGMEELYQQCDAQGRFDLPALLEAAGHTLTVRLPGDRESRKSQRVQPPSEDLEIVLAPGR